MPFTWEGKSWGGVRSTEPRRFLFIGLILHQMGGNGAIDCWAGGLYRERKRFLSQVPMGGDEKTSSSMTTSI
jgi:hypothetical protein